MYYICFSYSIKMKKNLFLIFIICISVSVNAQIKERLPCVDKKFSLVIHIVKDSLGDPGVTETNILKDIDSLSAKFKPICVSFEVCEFRYIDNWYYNIVKNRNWEEKQVLYNAKNRINIYYVNDIKNPTGGACGFAGLGSIGETDTSGVVLKKNCGGVRTLYHEIGHYFGLEHTFEKSTGSELADGSNCSTAGDGICDTPADPFVKGDDPANYVDGSCKFISMKKDSNGQYYDPLTGNIMSYYPGSCNCGFTHDQYMKMANTYLTQIGMW